MPQHIEPLLTAKDVAVILQCSTETVLRRAREGKLKGVCMTPKAGYRFRAQAVEDFIAHCKPAKESR